MDVNKEGLTEEQFLAQYNPGDYPRPSVTTDMILFTVHGEQDRITSLNVLLIKRGNHPYINHWALPGGFCGIDESLDVCAKRELKEETNVDNVYLEQLYTFSEPKRDPRMRVISTTYMALLPQGSVNVQAGDDATDAKWFCVVDNRNMLYLINNSTLIHYDFYKDGMKCTTKDKLAFDHNEQIQMALQRLINKMWYTPILFNLLPPTFTLQQVQDVYELVIGKRLVKSNFRTRIKRFIEETDEIQQNVKHRPSKIYRLKEEYLG